MRWIESQIPGHIRAYIVNYGHVDLDFTTLAFTVGITLLCGLIFGLAPAFGSSRLDVNRTLKEASSQASGSSQSARMRRIFVAAEIALADRKSTRLNSSHGYISYAVFCLKK